MTVGAGICVNHDTKQLVLGSCLLSDVHPRIVVTPDALIGGAFVGVGSDHPSGSRCVFPVGKLEGLRFMCVFRFKLWWMTQRMGCSAKEIPVETQFLIVEVTEDVYAVFLPILEGDFRAVLQGNAATNDLEICVESGDPDVQGFEGSHLVFVAVGSNPFDLITNAVKTVEKHLQTFSHHDKKKIPDMLNWFGWCTWDAFYTDITADGVRQGLQSFEKGGIHPKFVIIDDGWKSVEMDPNGVAYDSDNAANFANRLTHIKENHKFQKDGKKGHREEDPAKGFAHIVSEMKEKHSVKYVYVWHATTGYWGGLRPGAKELEPYEAKMTFPVSSPGIMLNEHCGALDSITANGLGLVNPEKVFSFYNELHSYLASVGIDGVKVDVQNILETLGAGHGGRVQLAKKYHQALEASISRNFHDNGIGRNTCLCDTIRLGIIDEIESLS